MKTRGFTLQGLKIECLRQYLAESELEYCKGYIVNNAGIYLLEYKCEYFYNIRKSSGYENEDFIKTLSEQFKSSYNQAKVIQNESSNSMIIFTSDSRFVIKTISKEEKRVFFRFLLESYYKRVLDCPNSRLIRILGIFKLLPSKITFMLMENSNPFKDPCLVFDLKGSSVDRLTKTKADLSSTVLKDENLLKLGRKIKLSSDDVSELLWTIKYDIEILRDIGIMDYSILLIAGKNRGISNRYSVGKDYSLAVIDLFQIYNSKKVLERFFKVCLRRADKDKLSSVSPGVYYNRILGFLEGMFTDSDEYDLSGML